MLPIRERRQCIAVGDAAVYSDYARILALTARNSGICLDPDLAVACADRAIAMYMSPQRPEADRGFNHATYLSDALAVASEIHGAHRRFDIALQAGELGVWVERRRVADGQPHARNALCAALARFGVHLRATGDPRAEEHLAEARAIDVVLVEHAFERWRWVEEGSHPARNTLADALSKAAAQLGRERVGEHIANTLLSDAVMRPGSRARVVFVPSNRCDPESGALIALELAELAQQMLARDLDCAYRLAVEAHFLLLTASRAQTPAMRYQFSQFGEPWARLLLATSRSFQAAGEDAVARDAAHWGFAAAMRLKPFTRAAESRALKLLIQECGEQYVQTLKKAGALAEAEGVRSALER